MSNIDSPFPIFSPSDLVGKRKIAEGTCSFVYEATVSSLKVAVKSLKPLDEIHEPLTRQKARQDFENEQKLNSYLRHPNIVLFLGCVRSKEMHGIIFEFCERGRAKCSAYGISRLPDALQLCLEVGRALCFAHSLNVIHRDVKPSQVLDFGDEVKLGDWGLATRVPEHGCESGETGTWEFMAPEVIRCDPYRESADVFSFGILLLCYVTGEAYPYRDKYITPAQASMGVAKDRLRPSLDLRLPKDIRDVITACWDGNAATRPSMSEVLRMVQLGINGIKDKAHDTSSNSWVSWVWGS